MARSMQELLTRIARALEGINQKLENPIKKAKRTHPQIKTEGMRRNWKESLERWNKLACPHGGRPIHYMTQGRKAQLLKFEGNPDAHFWETVEREAPIANYEFYYFLDFAYIIESEKNFCNFRDGRYRRPKTEEEQL